MSFDPTDNYVGSRIGSMVQVNPKIRLSVKKYYDSSILSHNLWVILISIKPYFKPSGMQLFYFRSIEESRKTLLPTLAKILGLLGHRKIFSRESNSMTRDPRTAWSGYWTGFGPWIPEYENVRAPLKPTCLKVEKVITGAGLVDHVHLDFYFCSRNALWVKKIFEILLMVILPDQRKVFKRSGYSWSKVSTRNPHQNISQIQSNPGIHGPPGPNLWEIFKILLVLIRSEIWNFSLSWSGPVPGFEIFLGPGPGFLKLSRSWSELVLDF